MPLLFATAQKKIVSYSYKETIRRNSSLSSMTWPLLQLSKYIAWFFLYKRDQKQLPIFPPVFLFLPVTESIAQMVLSLLQLLPNLWEFVHNIRQW